MHIIDMHWLSAWFFYSQYLGCRQKWVQSWLWSYMLYAFTIVQRNAWLQYVDAIGSTQGNIKPAKHHIYCNKNHKYPSFLVPHMPAVLGVDQIMASAQLWSILGEMIRIFFADDLPFLAISYPLYIHIIYIYIYVPQYIYIYKVYLYMIQYSLYIYIYISISK